MAGAVRQSGSMTHEPPTSTATPHAPGGHASAPGHDDHTNVSDPLGPVDLVAWGSGLGGLALGVLVAACLYIAAGGI
jgi:hypothetical protein